MQDVNCVSACVIPFQTTYNANAFFMLNTKQAIRMATVFSPRQNAPQPDNFEF